MVTRTALQLLSASLRDIGVLAGHEVPTSAQAQDAFERLNELIDQWGVQPGTMLLRRDVLVPWPSGAQTRTIGPGGQVNAPRPIALDSASLEVAGVPPTYSPLGVWTDADVATLSQPTLSGAQPFGVRYRPTVPFGELWIWPVPTAPVTIAIVYGEPVAQFPDLTTEVQLANGYATALRTNLAVALVPEYPGGARLDPLLAQQARESLADVKRSNLQIPPDLALDPGLTGCGGVYDIVTDT